jgi:hypothetical protein
MDESGKLADDPAVVADDLIWPRHEKCHRVL